MKNVSWCLMVIGMMACGEFETHTLHGDHPDVTAADDIVVTEKGSYTRKWVWLTREIPVCWERRPFLFRAHRKVVKTAIEDTWGREIMAKFTGWGTCTESSMGIRIRVSDKAPHTKGLGSQLDGQKDGMVLNFFFKDWCPDCAIDYVANIRSIAVHEFGHALGLTHEHNREDTPEWCEANQGSAGTTNVGQWDEHSVMNYCNAVYNNAGELSDGDKRTIRRAYQHLLPRPFRSRLLR